MASILDSGLVGLFSGIFTFLLVYALVWGVLSWKKPFGDKNAGVYAIIGFSTALLTSFIPPIRSFIGFIAPWYVAFGLVIFFILFITMIFGKGDKDFPKMLDDSRVYVWIIIISIVIAAAGLAFTFGQQTLEQTTGPSTTPTDNGNMVVIGGSNSGNGYQAPGTISAGTVNSGTPLGNAGQPGSTATSNFQTNLINTLFHPKVLGLLIVLVIASISIYFLSSN